MDWSFFVTNRNVFRLYQFLLFYKKKKKKDQKKSRDVRYEKKKFTNQKCWYLSYVSYLRCLHLSMLTDHPIPMLFPKMKIKKLLVWMALSLTLIDLQSNLHKP